MDTIDLIVKKRHMMSINII